MKRRRTRGEAVPFAEAIDAGGVLAIIVGIRTLLSLELELEIEGRFPWQRAGQADDRAASIPRGKP